MSAFRVERRHRIAVAVCAGGAVLALAGCSQVNGLAAGTSNKVFYVQSAAIDVLVKSGVEIKVAPACDPVTATTVSCANGQTTDGKEIKVEVLPEPTVAPGGEAITTIRVSVGGKQIYEGSVEKMLGEAGSVK